MLIRIFYGVLLILAVATPALTADIKIREWKFDKDPLGSVPTGFVPAKVNAEAGQWQLAEDPKATPRHVLMRKATDDGGKDQMIFIDGLEPGSLDLTVRIKTASADERQGGGVVFRATDERNYYLVWISPAEKRLRLDRLIDGEITHLQDLTLDSVDPNKWHTLRVMIHGPLMEAIYNNRQFLSGREEKWEFGTYKKGKIGFWARGAAPTYFDTVRYTNMDESTSSSGPFGVATDPAPKK
ncbi:MAG TPA: hypothetical protein VGJ57_09190 [Nitrospirales bacterium]